MYSSVCRVIEFLIWRGQNELDIFAKTEQTPKKLICYVNRHDAESTKIGHNLKI